MHSNIFSICLDFNSLKRVNVLFKRVSVSTSMNFSLRNDLNSCAKSIIKKSFKWISMGS
ncbi:hypothetical protein ES705_26626 [subsurface metagenome]